MESISDCITSEIDSSTQNRPYAASLCNKIRLFALMSGLFPLMNNLTAGPRVLGTAGVKAKYRFAFSNSATRIPHHVLVASGYDAWNSTAMAAGGSSCAAGLLIMLPTGTCDIHPSPAGRDLLAGAILQTIANSCPLHSATGCLSVNRD